jgi:hypothetical protein
MPAPTLEPQLYPAADSPAPGEYEPGQRVWVHRDGSWRPGVVLHCSDRAVTVRYRPAAGPGTGVDTVTGPCLAARAEDDPALDEMLALSA